MNVDIAILCAVPQEEQALTKKLTTIFSVQVQHNFSITQGEYHQRNVIILQCGVGAVNAAMATTWVIDKFNPQYLFFSGIAGSLVKHLSIGDVVICTQAFQAEAASHAEFAEHWETDVVDRVTAQKLVDTAESLINNETPLTCLGTIVSSETFPTPNGFEKIFTEKNAIAIDMETAAFYQTCHTFNKACIAVRGISNAVDEVLTTSAIALAAENAAGFSFNLIEKLIPINLNTQTASVTHKVQRLIDANNLQL